MGLVGNSQVDFETSVENEWLYLQILREFGLTVTNSELATFKGQRVLIVERFDRKHSTSGTWWMRLPQEDFCQAFGVSPNVKYESDGDPDFGSIARLLHQSIHPDQDRDTLLTAQILFWMLAATDGHAKNFSIRMLPGGQFQLAPLYDVLSAWPVIGRGGGRWEIQKVKLAMAVEGQNRHYKLQDIKRRYFNHMAYQHGFSQGAELIIQFLIERTPLVVESVRSAIPPGFPEEVAEAILGGLLKSADDLAKMPKGSPL